MIKAKKKYGQNFLIDSTVTKNIVDLINPQDEDTILEIGPGLGSITFPILDKIKKIDVIEIDPDMVAFLNNSKYSKKINIHTNDILKIQDNFFENFNKIIGNLPYYISSEILIKICNINKKNKKIYFMLQKEVAERISSPPGNKIYGRLSIIIQYFYDVEKLFDIAPNSFNPPPKINSSIVELIPKKEFKEKILNFVNFEKITKLAFGQKRKTIKNNFREVLSEADFEILNINPQNRPETLGVDDFVRIENYMDKRKIKI
ncbi:MAG: 16S rRNA (adenine(1518)-N(6)/adenine(1519)-N(6))-dimethyltransferase RsmA [Proteobacteria bacterium]|nr:16S rRNA (adenine(1518)-N(6)/adenine(1519)-N(6))-dimethyltransferase RsmA [Pseudomonadota bacterium]MDA1133432.1 16S rRNA (adenine(1518)-N(6)/adenine(1519)-N(6))-dimethyltransferase RsmA [Pseudomonadota bacterium]